MTRKTLVPDRENRFAFSRSIASPASVRPKKVEATYESGISEMTLPKDAKVKTKEVAVKAKGAELEWFGSREALADCEEWDS